MRVGWVFVACAALVIGGLYMYADEDLLPSTGGGGGRGRGDRSRILQELDWEGSGDVEEVVREAYTWHEAHRARQRSLKIVVLPDVGPREGHLARDVWKMANATLIISKHKRAPPPPAVVVNGTAVSAKSCGPLCGRHGWGECKEQECVCPVLYRGSECLSGVDVPREGPLKKLEPKFVGDLTLSKRALSGQKWLTVYLPDKQADNGTAGYKTIGAVTADLLFALPLKDAIPAGKVMGTCALVGGSGLMLHYAHGPEIDEADAVMRFNSAPAKGFELHVGNRTSYRETVLTFLRSRTALEALVRTKRRFPRMKLHALSADFVAYAALPFAHAPSVGLYGVMLALQRCHRVTLYGFQAYAEHNVTYHYYDQCDRPQDPVRHEHEFPVLKAMADLGLLSFREPCVVACHESPQECDKCKLRTGFQPVLLPNVTCPPCSLTREGCHKARHWAFRKGRVWPKLPKHLNETAMANATAPNNVTGAAAAATAGGDAAAEPELPVFEATS
eukprot:jgi/Mesen1/9607/ME000659S08986